MADMFQMLNGNEEMLDSMAYDSGEIICSYGDDKEYVQIAIRGDVKVYYKDEIYKYFTNMPEELQEMFKKGQYKKLDRVAHIMNNNWPEWEYYKDGYYVCGDVFDADTPTSKEVLKNECKILLKECRMEEEDNNHTGGVYYG